VTQLVRDSRGGDERRTHVWTIRSWTVGRGSKRRNSHGTNAGTWDPGWPSSLSHGPTPEEKKVQVAENFFVERREGRAGIRSSTMFSRLSFSTGIRGSADWCGRPTTHHALAALAGTYGGSSDVSRGGQTSITARGLRTAHPCGAGLAVPRRIARFVVEGGRSNAGINRRQKGPWRFRVHFDD